jgi:hypothetical protein
MTKSADNKEAVAIQVLKANQSQTQPGRFVLVEKKKNDGYFLLDHNNRCCCKMLEKEGFVHWKDFKNSSQKYITFLELVGYT